LTFRVQFGSDESPVDNAARRAARRNDSLASTYAYALTTIRSSEGKKLRDELLRMGSPQVTEILREIDEALEQQQRLLSDENGIGDENEWP
jgi:hypothetical protein